MPLILICLADLLSIFACILVLARVASLPASSRQRLFPRQVAVLAIADTFFSVSRIPWDLKGFQEEGISEWFLFLLYWSYEATLLSELSIVLGFALQTRRCDCGLKALRRHAWVPLVLSAGGALATLKLRSRTLPWATEQAVATLLCLIVASFCLGVVICQQSNTTTDAVVYRGWNRATAFLVNFLLTMAPDTVLVLLYPELYSDRMNGYRLITTLCLHCNGLINCLTYLYQSRYASRSVSHAACGGSVASLQVRFVGVAPCDLVATADPSSSIILEPASTDPAEVRDQSTEGEEVV